MFYSKLITSLVLMFYLISPSLSMSDNDQKINCSIQRKCSTDENIVWALYKKRCYLFRNSCVFANEMCLRRAQNKDEYKLVTKKECKKYCQDCCTRECAPICAEHNNTYKSFGNRCEFYRQSCRQNKSYIFLQTGCCDEALEP